MSEKTPLNLISSLSGKRMQEPDGAGEGKPSGWDGLSFLLWPVKDRALGPLRVLLSPRIARAFVPTCDLLLAFCLRLVDTVGALPICTPSLPISALNAAPSNRTFGDNRTFPGCTVLWVPTCHRWLLGTWSGASVTEKWNFTCHLILISVDLKSHMG